MKKLFDLIETRKLIALSIVLTACYMALNGTIESKDFYTLAVTIISFYFGFKRKEV
jgi:hypothetical protein